ncbi:hypothetical protein LPB90_18410 [Chryseobacterium sp. LC2016-29]|uniref:hypothetical protein n=1 Tax=Chryseobacterium sp. LC2016-29 TaxID=2897331 RepID=UPI001E3E9B60|nr:hypothetical protein [Chryseobacterium sp. LC2016-29]MCD0480416.1 hypothetical protein [Chryseobacterium sp. LC2016-29]
MKRYYFYKRTNSIADIIEFSLCALYSTLEYSQKLRKDIDQFHYFDDIKLCLATKTQGVYRVRVDSGTDGCTSHWATSLKELKQAHSKDEYLLISERDYFRLRRLAFKLIFKHINFFKPTESLTRNFFYQNSFSRSFYDIKLISTSEKENIYNYPESTVDFYKENKWKLYDCRLDESFRIFISKDKNYKSNKFEIESSHFGPYYEDLQEFLKSSNLDFKNNKVGSIKDFQFQRLKKYITEMILDRSDLDISSILPKQTDSITILDI